MTAPQCCLPCSMPCLSSEQWCSFPTTKTMLLPLRFWTALHKHDSTPNAISVLRPCLTEHIRVFCSFCFSFFHYDETLTEQANKTDIFVYKWWRWVGATLHRLFHNSEVSKKPEWSSPRKTLNVTCFWFTACFPLTFYSYLSRRGSHQHACCSETW